MPEIKEANEQKTTALAKRDWLKKYSELLLTREQQKEDVGREASATAIGRIQTERTAD